MRIRDYVFLAIFGLLFVAMFCFAAAKAIVLGSIGHPGMALVWGVTTCATSCALLDVCSTYMQWRRDDRQWKARLDRIDALIRRGELDQATAEAEDASRFLLGKQTTNHGA
jgi:hypothetical protein